jgi:L-lactate utilization protein LutB
MMAVQSQFEQTVRETLSQKKKKKKKKPQKMVWWSGSRPQYHKKRKKKLNGLENWIKQFYN